MQIGVLVRCIQLCASVSSHPFLHIAILLMGSLCLGFLIGYPSPTSQDIAISFSLSDMQTALFISLPWLGALLGPFFAHAVIGAHSHRTAIQAASLFGAMSWAVLLTAGPKDQLYVLIHRATLGIVFGALNLILPWCMVEIAPLDTRWISASMHQLGLHIGVFLVNFAALFFDWWELGALVLTGFALFLVLAGFISEPAFVPTVHCCSAGDDYVAWSHVFGRGNWNIFLTYFLLMIIQKVGGIAIMLPNLRAFVGGQKQAAGAALALSVGLLATLKIGSKLSRFAYWCISLFVGAAALFCMSWNLRHTHVPWMSAVTTTVFFFTSAFGLLPIPEHFQAEAFQNGRIRFAAKSAFAIIDYACTFAALQLYSCHGVHRHLPRHRDF
jgi:MFS family permease